MERADLKEMNGKSVDSPGILSSPESKRILERRVDLSEVSESAQIACLAVQRAYGLAADSVTSYLCTADGDEAYPVVGGVPFLVNFAPRLPDEGTSDLWKQIEVYEAMARQNLAGEEAPVISDSLGPEVPTTALERDTFPMPIERWLDAPYDSPAQFRAYNYLVPIFGKAVLQLGGQGDHAVKLLLAGAVHALLVTPVYGEALYAEALARNYGVIDRFGCIVGTAENLPLVQSSIDRVYAGGTLHHTDVKLAVDEILRVLKPAGKFAAVEPWRAPLYRVGTSLFGNRERDVLCRPIDQSRLPELSQSDGVMALDQFGTFTRYPLLAMSKLGIRPSLKTVWRIFQADDWVAAKIPFVRRFGSSLCVTVSKPIR